MITYMITYMTWFNMFFCTLCRAGLNLVKFTKRADDLHKFKRIQFSDMFED